MYIVEIPQLRAIASHSHLKAVSITQHIVFVLWAGIFDFGFGKACGARVHDSIVQAIPCIPKIAPIWLGIHAGIHEVVASHGRQWTAMYRKLLIFGWFRHKKGRPWTPLDVYLVEPGGADLLASEGSIPLVSTDF